MSIRALAAAVLAVLAALAWAAPPAAGPAPAAGAESSDLVLILDASGSMWGQVGGENKIVVARRVLGELLDGLPEGGGDVGLIAYGHRREGDCADIEAVAPLAPLDRAALKRTVDALNPKGKTPITASIERAFDALAGRDRPATVILVSDGLETCGGDPCVAVREAKRAGVDFVMHVVGFDVAGEDVSSLECVAQAGGGLFLPAEDAAGLAGALAAAVESSVEEIPDGRLSVKVTANGRLHDAAVSVVRPGTGETVAGGRTYAGAETNPRVIPLADGSYRARVQAVGLEGDIRREFDFDISDGSTEAREFDFSAGELSIGVTRNGARSDATYNVTVPGSPASVAGGRTYTAERSNPGMVTLTAGTYQVEVRSVEVAGDQRVTLGPVEVPPGGSAAVSHEWFTGVLRVGAVEGETLVDATVHVYEAGGPSVGGGRTYTKEASNPKEFVVLPGAYRIVVQRIRGPRKEVTATVEAGGTTVRMVDFEE